MKQIRYLFLTVAGIFLMGSCHKIEQLPARPEIEFTSFKIFDTLDILGNHSKGGRLKFHFQDGNSDLGLAVPNGTQPDSTNMFLTLFRKEGGVMVPAPANDPLTPSEYRIPYMVRLGQNKILKGTISVTFLYLFYSPTDTIKYDFYIKDRALLKSNVASTNEIVISVNNTY